ncbi:MAG: hypothetical protein WCF95_07780 [bacterium]
MDYKEFLDLVDSLEEGQTYYFKPEQPEILNAYNPDVRPHLFQLTMGSDKQYRLRYLLLLEEIRLQKTKLEKMFLERNWVNYMPFNLIDDYNDWLQTHPESCL